MPDLSLIPMQQCESCSQKTNTIGGYLQSGLGSERTWPTCTCPSYVFRRIGVTNFAGRIVSNPCKHIRQHMDDICDWHELTGPETIEEDGVCPRCGGKTEFVLVGV